MAQNTKLRSLIEVLEVDIIFVWVKPKKNNRRATGSLLHCMFDVFCVVLKTSPFSANSSISYVSRPVHTQKSPLNWRIGDINRDGSTELVISLTVQCSGVHYSTTGCPRHSGLRNCAVVSWLLRVLRASMCPQDWAQITFGSDRSSRHANLRPISPPPQNHITASWSDKFLSISDSISGE